MTNKINTKIKIPKEWYAGFAKSRDELPVVYMTPNGTDKASQAKIRTVKGYSNGENGIPDTVMPNTPLCGFKILFLRYGGYNTGNIVWRVEDPRGFQSEIPSGNLNQLLNLTTIDHGEILESCVWARDGKYNVLLPTNSEEYQVAVKNTDLASKSVGISKVKIGNIVHLKNGLRDLKYLGKYCQYVAHERYKRPSAANPLVSTFQHYYEDSEGVLHSYGTGNIAEIVSTETMDPIKAERKLNKAKSSVLLMSVLPEIGKNMWINLVPYDLHAAVASTTKSLDFNVMAKLSNGTLAICQHPYWAGNWRNRFTMDFYYIQTEAWNRGDLEYKSSASKSQYVSYDRRKDILEVDTQNMPQDVDFYQIEYIWKVGDTVFKKVM